MSKKAAKPKGPRETRVRAENMQIGDVIIFDEKHQRTVLDVDYTSTNMCNVAVSVEGPVRPMHFKSDEKVWVRRDG